MLVINGIINGYYDNTFRPDEYMTRAELVTVIDNILDLESETDRYVSDVTSKDWYNSNIRKAIYFGIIQGDDKGKINPNSKVTREEAVVIIARAFRIEIDEAYFNSSFKDANKISDWARKEYISFIRKQYIEGYEDNTIRPKRSITRAEILTILNRIIKNISLSTYSAKITGKTLVKERDIIMNNVEIYGDLIVGERASKTIKFSNTIVNGNLVLYAPLDMGKNTIAINGNVINAYENSNLATSYYRNEEFGITFPIPNGASTYNEMPSSKEDYSKKDLIIVNVDKNEEYYYQSMDAISKKMIKQMGYDSIFVKIAEGEIQKYPYELYTDSVTSNLLMIKRDNVVYSILFLNTVSNNIIDNVISNLIFTSGTSITNHDTVIYKNSKLALKFSYKNGYVGVDDSYNTNNVYSGDSIFKMFIQVNMITDIDDYSVEEVKTLLKTFVKNDGKIVDEKVMNLNNHQAIEFEIQSEDNKIISLYVIIGNNLYNFIFKGNTEKMELLGKSMFDTIVNSMEF